MGNIVKSSVSSSAYPFSASKLWNIGKSKLLNLFHFTIATLCLIASPSQSLAATILDCIDCPEMVVIPSGSFEMGSNLKDNEGPVHKVTIAKSFAMGKTEVTQGQWKAIMGSNPSYFSSKNIASDCCAIVYEDCDNCPVERVSWEDAKAFVEKLTAKTGKQYRLPSEAEWEYACRAGGQQEFCGSDNLDKVAWHGDDGGLEENGNSGSTTNPVATKEANAWGLYDMSGNVWEWVEDSYHDNYIGAPPDGSAWQGDGTKRVIRGGGWGSIPQLERAANRLVFGSSERDNLTGFRVVRVIP